MAEYRDADGDGIPDALEGFIPDELSPERIIEALMAALEAGVRYAVELASAAGGFFGNPAIFIPWPESLEEVKGKLEKIKLGGKVEDFVEKLNHAAEAAAGGAVDIFISAIRGLSFERAREVLDGGMNAATTFLRETCLEPLKEMMRPIVDSHMGECDEIWEKLVKAFNKVSHFARTPPHTHSLYTLFIVLSPSTDPHMSHRFRLLMILTLISSSMLLQSAWTASPRSSRTRKPRFVPTPWDPALSFWSLSFQRLLPSRVAHKHQHTVDVRERAPPVGGAAMPPMTTNDR